MFSRNKKEFNFVSFIYLLFVCVALGDITTYLLRKIRTVVELSFW